MYSKNEAILDFKKKQKKKKKTKKKKTHKKTTQNDKKKKKKKKKMFFFKKLNQLNFFSIKIETDQPASRLRIQPV